MTKKKKDDGNIKGTPKYDRWNSVFGEKGDRKMAEKLKKIMNKGKIKETE